MVNAAQEGGRNRIFAVLLDEVGILYVLGCVTFGEVYVRRIISDGHLVRTVGI